MEKKGITQEQVDEAVREYGLTIDPRQFEKKKRGRRTTTAREMAPGLAEDLPVDFGSDDEPPPRERAERDAMGAEDHVPARREVIEVSALPSRRPPAPAEEGELEDDEELDEDDYVPPPLTIQGINEMKKEDVLKVCAYYNINTAQPLKTLRLELKGKVV